MDNPTSNVVHETEIERQHPRVRIPAIVQLEAGGHPSAYRVLDISAGGFSFDSRQDSFRVGQIHHATLKFAMDPMGMTLPIDFRVCNTDSKTHRVGSAFEDLDTRQIALLRQVINACLAGELVSVNDVLTTLSRDNYARPRGQKAIGSPQPRARSRALSLTTVLFVIGAAAFAYALTSLYGVLFITHALAAKVAAPTYAITMPRDGTWFNLVPPNGRIGKGQPLGTFQAAMLDVVQNDPGSLHLTPQQMSQLMGETLKGTLSSPCNCTVQEKFVLDSQFVNRNQPLMVLLPDKGTPYVLARFHFDNIQDLAIGRTVNFRVSGEGSDRYGTIIQVRLLPGQTSAEDASTASDLRGLNTPGTVSDVLAEIRPNRPLARDLIDRPVDVRLGDPRSSVDGAFRSLAQRTRTLFAGL